MSMLFVIYLSPYLFNCYLWVEEFRRTFYVSYVRSAKNMENRVADYWELIADTRRNDNTIITRGMVCLLWVQSLIDVFPLLLPRCMQ